MNHLQPWTLLPAPKGKCPECAGDHAPDFPHNAQSMFYQYSFYNRSGRWPNWMDALEHCALDMQLLWLFELEMLGVDVEGGRINPKPNETTGE